MCDVVAVKGIYENTNVRCFMKITKKAAISLRNSGFFGIYTEGSYFAFYLTK